MFLYALLLIPIFSLNALVKPDGCFDLETASKHTIHFTSVLKENDSEQAVISLDQGIVVNHGAIVSGNGKLCIETAILKDDPNKIIKNGLQKEPIVFDGKLAVISSLGQENWYHWLLQVLPRLKILKDSGVAYDKIYLADLEYEWQKKSLQMVLDYLNISKEDLFLIKGDEVIQATTLIVPTVPFIPARQRRVMPQWERDFLFNVFLTDYRSVQEKRLYISRSKARCRNVINEDALIEMLKKYDFEIVHLETLHPSEQAALFNQARIVIASHGSGLTNLIFSNPEVKVIEIDHKLDQEEQRSFFKRLTHMVKGHYYPFYTDTVSEDNLDDDLFVDLDHFEKLLKQIM